MILRNLVQDEHYSWCSKQGSRGAERARIKAIRCSQKNSDKSRTCRLINVSKKPRFVPTTPLYHLEGRYSPRYQQNADFNTDSDFFDVSLELMNRRGVRKTLKPLNGATQRMAKYFFEKVGKVNVVMRLCVKCRDVGKKKGELDHYFIDLMEIAMNEERTVLCSKCMEDLMRLNVQTSSTGVDEIDEILIELEVLRNEQPHGIVVNPFLITCGY